MAAGDRWASSAASPGSGSASEGSSRGLWQSPAQVQPPGPLVLLGSPRGALRPRQPPQRRRLCSAAALSARTQRLPPRHSPCSVPCPTRHSACRPPLPPPHPGRRKGRGRASSLPSRGRAGPADPGHLSFCFYGPGDPGDRGTQGQKAEPWAVGRGGAQETLHRRACSGPERGPSTGLRSPCSGRRPGAGPGASEQTLGHAPARSKPKGSWRRALAVGLSHPREKSLHSAQHTASNGQAQTQGISRLIQEQQLQERTEAGPRHLEGGSGSRTGLCPRPAEGGQRGHKRRTPPASHQDRSHQGRDSASFQASTPEGPASRTSAGSQQRPWTETLARGCPANRPACGCEEASDPTSPFSVALLGKGRR